MGAGPWRGAIVMPGMGIVWHPGLWVTSFCGGSEVPPWLIGWSPLPLS